MKLIVIFFAAFLSIGIFFRDFDNKTRFCLFLVAASAVIYISLK